MYNTNIVSAGLRSSLWVVISHPALAQYFESRYCQSSGKGRVCVGWLLLRAYRCVDPVTSPTVKTDIRSGLL